MTQNMTPSATETEGNCKNMLLHRIVLPRMCKYERYNLKYMNVII